MFLNYSTASIKHKIMGNVSGLKVGWQIAINNLTVTRESAFAINLSNRFAKKERKLNLRMLFTFSWSYYMPFSVCKISRFAKYLKTYQSYYYKVTGIYDVYLIQI